MLYRYFLPLLLLLPLASCRPPSAAQSLDVRIAVDGSEQLYSARSSMTVDQLLASAQIEMGPLDRISHPLVAQIADEMLITIRRVREEEICDRHNIPYERHVLPKEGLPPSGRQLGQVGAVGVEEACFRIVFEDEEEVRRVLTDEPVIVKAPIAEIIYTGPEQIRYAYCHPRPSKLHQSRGCLDRKRQHDRQAAAYFGP